MNKGALALLIHGGTENWSPERWKKRFDVVCRDRGVFLSPDAAFDPADVQYAAVWKPRPGELAAFPNLRVIFNLGAGVDALMADSTCRRCRWSALRSATSPIAWPSMSCFTC